MKLIWESEFHGPNPWALVPVVVAELQLTAAERLSVAQASRVLASHYPHWCVTEAESASSLEDGDKDAALLEGVHIMLCWALGALNEVRGYLDEAGAVLTAFGVRIWLGFHAADVSRAAIQLALGAVTTMLRPGFGKDSLQPMLHKLWVACQQQHPDYQARILMAGARALDVPVLHFLPGSKYWQFGWGANSRVFFESASNADGYLGGQWQHNKQTAKAVFSALGIPTASHQLVMEAAELTGAARQVGYPCVVKPVDSGGGRGVTANISDEVSLHQAFLHARQYSAGPIMVESHVAGVDHRLMVVGGKLARVVRRDPSYLTGDGVSTVKQLLAACNAERSTNLLRSGYLRPVKEDEMLFQHLSSQGVFCSDVLAKDKRISLRSNANVSTGGTFTDVSDLIHPQLRDMAEQIALSMGITTAGVDYITTDIREAPSVTGGAFIEINSTPALELGVARGWTDEQMGRLVLGDGLGRIAVDMTIASNDRVQGILEALRSRRLDADHGWVCNNEIRIGEANLQCRIEAPWAAVHTALRNQRLTGLHIVCTPKEILNHGLPVDGLTTIALDGVHLPVAWEQVLSRVQKNGEYE